MAYDIRPADTKKYQYAMIRLRKILPILIMFSAAAVSCTKDDPIPAPDNKLVLCCTRPDYLKAGDKVALISPVGAWSRSSAPMSENLSMDAMQVPLTKG